MLDKKSLNILKLLNKLTDGSAYKVVTTDEILSQTSQRSQYDLEELKQILDFLEKQEYIIIKFSEENTYCFSLLPKARILLESESIKSKSKHNNTQSSNLILPLLSSFIGTMLALLIFFYVTF